MKKIMILFILLSCMFVYGEEKNYENKNTSQAVINANHSLAMWGPYMRDVEQKIKSNWNPPKNKSSKRTVVNFVITKDGNLADLKILTSSGIEEVDKAALNAVQKTAPFKPLPEEYMGVKEHIEWTSLTPSLTLSGN